MKGKGYEKDKRKRIEEEKKPINKAKRFIKKLLKKLGIKK